MDHILPIPAPDWDNPQPSDAPVPEEVDAFVGLTKLRDGLTRWMAATAGHSLLPVQWRQLIAMLNDAADKCIPADTDPIATHRPALIKLQPHPPVPDGPTCVRCALPVADRIHNESE